MKLTRVTFTGADESVDPAALVEISRRHPWVEWGILFSQSNQSQGPRYPDYSWISDLLDMNANRAMHLSAHLCGQWVRDVVVAGEFTWEDEWMDRAALFERVQLNFHGQFHKMHADFPKLIQESPMFDFILQCDNVNDLAVQELVSQPIATFPLFDQSGAAGIVPRGWPMAWTEVYCGFAGGLGPETVLDELPRIAAAAHGQDFWIDMERNVRSEEDTVFDLEKVRAVIRMVEPFVEVA